MVSTPLYVKMQCDKAGHVLRSVSIGKENDAWEYRANGKDTHSQVMRCYCIGLILAAIRIQAPKSHGSTSKLGGLPVASSKRPKNDWVNVFYNCFGKRRVEKYPKWYKDLTDYLSKQKDNRPSWFSDKSRNRIIWSSLRYAPTLSIIVSDQDERINIHICKGAFEERLTTTNQLFAFASALLAESTFHNKDLQSFIPYQLALSDTAIEELPPQSRSYFPRLHFGFINHESELSQICSRLLLQDDKWGVIIRGEGGLGKTAIATYVSQLLRDRFQTIYVTTQNEYQLPSGTMTLLGAVSSFSEILRSFAEQLGILNAEFLKRSDKEQIETLAGHLHGTGGVLFVIDNIDCLNKNELHDLLSLLEALPRHCKAIVTSRIPVDIRAFNLPIKPLDDDFCLELAREVGKNTGHPTIRNISLDQIRRLSPITKGNPLFLCWILGQLYLGKCKTVDEAITIFENAPSENDPWSFAFKTLIASLDSASEKVLTALTILSAPADGSVLARVSGLHLDAALLACSTLTNISLIGRHSEIQFIAIAKATKYVRETMAQRHERLIRSAERRLVSYIYDLVRENGYTNHSRFFVLDEAWGHILSALALRRYWDNRRLQALCFAMRDFLNCSGRWEKWRELCVHAEKIALRSKDFLNAGWRAFELGFYYRLRGDGQHVLQCAHRADEHWQKARATPNEVIALERLLGLGYRQCERFPDAISHLKRAYDLCLSALDNGEQQMLISNDLGGAERAYGAEQRKAGRTEEATVLYKEARIHYERALSIAQRRVDREGMCYCIGNIAMWEFDCENWEFAEGAAKVAMDLAKEIRRMELVAYNCVILGGAVSLRGDKTKGVPLVREGVRIFAELKDRNLRWAKEVLERSER